LKDFVNIDIRVGEIKECWKVLLDIILFIFNYLPNKHPESENLYCEKIDIGGGEIREIASGL